MSDSPANLALRLRTATANGAGVQEVARLQGEVDELFTQHQGRVYAACLRFVRSPEQAKELAQDVLLTAFVKLPEFRGESEFSTWLYGIARNRCMNAIRKRSESLTDDGIFETTDLELSVVSQMRREERRALIIKAAAAVLDPHEQEAVYLRYAEGLSQDQITQVLEISGSSGARGLLQRCRRKLKVELARQLDAMGHGTSFVRGSIE